MNFLNIIIPVILNVGYKLENYTTKYIVLVFFKGQRFLEITKIYCLNIIQEINSYLVISEQFCV